MGQQLEQRRFDRFSRRWLCALVTVLSISFAACTPVLGRLPDLLLR